MFTQVLFNTRVFVRTVAIGASLLAFAACGSAPSTETHEAKLQINGFASYVTSFQNNAAEFGHPIEITDLIIQFGPVDSVGEHAGRGVCERTTNETPVITISETAWASSNDAEREGLIFHELGHCVLNKAHVSGVSEVGIPKSLMNPYKIDGSIYSQYKQYYLSGLFQ